MIPILYTLAAGAAAGLALYKSAKTPIIDDPFMPFGDDPRDALPAETFPFSYAPMPARGGPLQPTIERSPVVQSDSSKVSASEQAARDAMAEPILRAELNDAIERGDDTAADALAREMTRRGFKL